MKKTQDQRFLEYAGIITSGKLQERGKRKTHIHGVLKAFGRHTKSRSAACVSCVNVGNSVKLHLLLILLCSGQQHKQTDEAVLQSAEVLR